MQSSVRNICSFEPEETVQRKSTLSNALWWILEYEQIMQVQKTKQRQINISEKVFKSL